MDYLTTRGITWNRNDHRRGYTLLETLLAMVVLGIIVGSVSAPLRGLALRSRLSRSTTTVSSDLARAFSLAERSQRPVRLRCDEAQSALVIEDRDSGIVLAAVTALAGVTLGSSRDQISGAGGAGLTSAGYPRRAPAVSVPDGLVSGDPTIPRGGPGNPDIQYLGSGSDALAAVNVDWNAIVNGGALVPDAEFAANSDGCADPAYRLPTGGGFPVIYAHGNYTFDQGSSVVTGLLIVENDLILDKQIEFQGVMLVGGTIIDTAHVGDAQVHGSVITGLNLKLPGGALPGYPPPAPLMLGNTGTTGRQFMWDANAVQQAMARFGPPLVRRIRSTRSDNLPGS